MKTIFIKEEKYEEFEEKFISMMKLIKKIEHLK